MRLRLQHIFWVDIFSSIQLFRHVQLFLTPWTTAHEASLSITNSQSLLKVISIKPVMPSNHLILCHPLLLSPSIFPSIRVFSGELAPHQVAKVLELQHQLSFDFFFSFIYPIDAFELWCWRRLLNVPWTARRSNQSILKEISPGC